MNFKTGVTAYTGFIIILRLWVG